MLRPDAKPLGVEPAVAPLAAPGRGESAVGRGSRSCDMGGSRGPTADGGGANTFGKWPGERVEGEESHSLQGRGE